MAACANIYGVLLKGYVNNGLASIIGDRPIVSKIMSKKRKINLRMARIIYKATKIPYALLMKKN